MAQQTWPYSGARWWKVDFHRQVRAGGCEAFGRSYRRSIREGGHV